MRKLLYLLTITILISTTSCTRHDEADRFMQNGRVHEENGDFDKAMLAYKQAYKYAEKANDSLLMWKIPLYIGHLFQMQAYFEQALDSYRVSAEKCGDDKQKLAESYGAMGGAFLLMGENNSAFFYMNKGIELSKQSDDKELQNNLIQNLSIAYREAKMYEESENCLRLAMQMNNDSTEIIRYHLCFAELYLLMNEADSCRHYENILMAELDDVKDDILLAGFYSYLSKIAEHERKFDTAYHYLNKSSKMEMKIYEKNLKKNIYEVRKKYDYERLENIYNQRLVKRQRTIVCLLLLLLLTAIVTIIAMFRLLSKKKIESSLRSKVSELDQENRKIREEQIEYLNNIEELKENIAILETKNHDLPEIDEIRQELNSLQVRYEKNNVSLMSNLRKRIDLIIKIESWQSSRKADTDTWYRKLRDSLYGRQVESLPDAMFKIFDDTFPGLGKKIRHEFEELNDTEYKICMLSFLPLTVQDIADLLGQSINTVGKARTNIRKKIGMEESGGDFCEYIKQKLNY